MYALEHIGRKDNPHNVTAAQVTGLGTMATQNASAVAITGGTIAGLTGFAIRNAGSGAFDMTVAYNGTLTAGRTLTWSLNDAARTISLSGNLTVSSTATISGTNTGDQTSVSGNAGTATALQTARNINGVSFNGTADITVTAAAGTLTGATLAAGVTASSLTSVGTLATGTWQATVIAGQYGGTGVANIGKTITLGGNLTTSGAFASTFTMTNTTAVTFPTSGTLATVSGALGTPTSVTLTNGTGLPISTGVSGLGAGVATWAATPSSANLAAALTDEIGSGGALFGTDTTSFTPGLTFGGGATGMTGTFVARYAVSGNIVFFTINITLTAKGSSTGTNSFTGLPFTVSAAVTGVASVQMTNMTSGVGDSFISVLLAGSGTAARLDKYAAGAAVPMTDADFTNTSTIRISGFYIK